MATIQEQSRMIRKQYRLSAESVRRIKSLKEELGLDSEAEVVRLAIETFDPDALAGSDRELVEVTAKDLLTHLHALNVDIDVTLDRARNARERIADPKWLESIRERTRNEAANDPALVKGMTALIGP